MRRPVKASELGIENLKKALAPILELGIAVGESLEDGKWGIDDISNFFAPLSSLVPAVSSISDAKLEYKDLDEYEREDLEKWAIDKFNIPQKDIERRVEAAFVAVINLLVVAGL